MSHVDQLRTMVSVLEEAYDAAKVRIEKEMPDVNPLEVRSVDGRFILLDSLTVLVNAKTALREWDW